jgi:16S rRNA (guanine(966)-N(2))-methyltransferase RsmD
MIRVIGGSAKGRRLSSIRDITVRPTSEKVRGAVFDILQGYFPFKRAVDIFAGTGAMGIEALSRGVAETVFIDSNPDVVSLIRKNLEKCGFSAKAKVLKMDAINAIELFINKGERFDLIFIDPPYDDSLTLRVLERIDTNGILSPGAMVVSESSKRMVIEGKLNSIELFKRKRYGDTVVSFYRTVSEG